MIDNYDSFTYNLVHLLKGMNPSIEVIFNDEKNYIKWVEKAKIVFISPGPSVPKNAGISVDVIKNFYTKKPIFGVCLGHQAIAYNFGGKIVKAKRIMHGKVSAIYHNKKYIFKNIPSPFNAVRYHSLSVSKNKFPLDLKILARSEDEEIMSIKHKDYPLYGVQFHPESILTDFGELIVYNFLQEVKL
jgi:anthranilate synthase component 2